MHMRSNNAIQKNISKQVAAVEFFPYLSMHYNFTVEREEHFSVRRFKTWQLHKSHEYTLIMPSEHEVVRSTCIGF